MFCWYQEGLDKAITCIKGTSIDGLKTVQYIA